MNLTKIERTKELIGLKIDRVVLQKIGKIMKCNVK